MIEFSTQEGPGSYEDGVIALPDGRHRGIEAVVRMRVRPDASPAALPDLLGSLRGALPAGERLSMPLRLAVSTVRAGLGAIEDELTPGGGERVTVEIVLADGSTIVARMPSRLAAAMGRDRALVLAALARAAPATAALPSPADAEPDGTAEALTSIFRYEKRQGRLRRVTEPDRKD